jgi:hypothetical protein
VSRDGVRHSRPVVGEQGVRPNRTQVWLAVGAGLSYAIGYPVALVGGSGFGWVLVTLGGVFLLGLGAVTVRRIAGGGGRTSR